MILVEDNDRFSSEIVASQLWKILNYPTMNQAQLRVCFWEMSACHWTMQVCHLWHFLERIPIPWMVLVVMNMELITSLTIETLTDSALVLMLRVEVTSSKGYSGILMSKMNLHEWLFTILIVVLANKLLLLLIMLRYINTSFICQI